MTDFFSPGQPLEPSIRRRAWDVFISYAHDDSDIARGLATELEGRGYTTWIDAKLKKGEPLRTIEEALHSCAAVIVVVSMSSLPSQWVAREVDQALSILPSRFVFPVAIDKLDASSLPPWLVNRTYLHLRDRTRINKLVDQLVPALDDAIGGPRNALGGAPVFGNLPPREPLVGAFFYLRELLAVHTGITWIVGMPGSGKTSLAREYVHQVRDDVAFVLWLPATGCRTDDIADQLRVVDELRSSAKQQPGLLVVDALDELTDEPHGIVSQLGEIGTLNRVLITTRRLSDTRLLAAHQRSVLTVGPLPHEAAAEYLDRHVPDLPARERARLATMAGGSPAVLRLLTQALRTTSIEDLLNSPSPDLTITRAIRALLETLTPGQHDRLNVLAFCAGLLTTIRGNKRWTLSGDDELFSRLLQWGIFDASADGSITAHPKIVALLQEGAPREALEEAIRYVSTRLPDPDSRVSRDLLPSVVELTEVAEFDWSPAVSANVAELLIWQASTWRTVGDYERAELLCRRALELAAEADDTTLRIRALNLQSALAFDRGDIAQATRVEQQTAELASTTFGPEHPLTTASLANLAISLRALGDLAQAITLLRRVVDRNQRSLPHEHPDVIASRINLAICLRDAGLYHEALELLSEAPARMPDAQTDLRLARIRAAILTDMGRAEEALTVLQESLARAEGALLSSPTEILMTSGSLAMVSAALGRHDEALTIQTNVADQCELVLGPNHPSTLNARSNQAKLLAQLGMTEDSLRLLLEVADSRSRILGPDHPDTLQSRLLAARALRDDGQNEQAFDMYSDLVGRTVRTLGPDHAMSLTIREEFAQQLGRVGNTSGAHLAYRELLADLDRVLPRNHPMVRRIRATVTDEV